MRSIKRRASGPLRRASPSIAAWLQATRPRTLVAACVPVAVGTAAAHGAGADVRWAAVALAAAAALLLQIAANLVNDAADAARGVDGPDRLGPTRVVHGGLLAARAVWGAAAAATLAAFGCGVALAVWRGWPIVVLGLTSIAAAWAYSAGRRPLSALGAGELTAALFFGGVAVAGSAYVAGAVVPATAIVGAVVVASWAAAMMMVNNLRDRHSDARAGRRTLAVRLGGDVVRRLYLGAVLTALLAPLALTAQLGWRAALPLAIAPWAAAVTLALQRRDGRALTPLLGATAQLLLVHGALVTVAWWPRA